MGGALKTVIIGGVAGGASAAARLRRLDEQAEIILFERGAHISYANCGLPYYVGQVIQDEDSLYVQTPSAMKSRFNIDVRTNSEVIAIDRAGKTVLVKKLESGREYTETYDKLILSPGAEPFIPSGVDINLPGVFTFHNIRDGLALRRFIDEQKVNNAVIVGGGFIGIELAENLYHRKIEVTLIEGADQVLAPFDYDMAAIIQNHLRQNKIQLITQTVVTHVEQVENGQARILSVHMNNGQTLEADMIVLGIGIRPKSELAEKAGLKLGERKGIWVNEFQQTSDPDIYAAGDGAETFDMNSKERVMLALAGPANRQGRLAADNIGGQASPFQGVAGTAILKVFDKAAACTGYNEKQLKRLGNPYEKVFVYPLSHAGYYPGGTQMALKLLFAPDTGAILGGQAIGKEGVDKAIDLIAAAYQFGGTVNQLAQLELAYAPPFSSAKAPVNVAGFVAGNVLNRESRILHWHDVGNLIDEDWTILDVRTRAEYNEGHIEGAELIPLDELRKNLHRLDNRKRILIYCRVGLRGYLGERILCQNGFNEVYNLSGGYQLYAEVEKNKKAVIKQPS